MFFQGETAPVDVKMFGQETLQDEIPSSIAENLLNPLSAKDFDDMEPVEIGY